MKRIGCPIIITKRIKDRSEDQHSGYKEKDMYRDIDYWNEYYRHNPPSADNKPCDFAKFIESEFLYEKKPAHILELGCGNGRDSLFFLSKGHKTTAVDESNVAIEMLNQITDSGYVLFVCDDFVKSKALRQMKYDCIYSRFTLHAISEEQEDELLNNARTALNDNGILAIEARTTNDELYGKGIEIEKNAFIYNDHYRRFIDVNEFRKKIEKLGYDIIYLEESDGFSRTQNSDPVLMRCICTAINQNAQNY